MNLFLRLIRVLVVGLFFEKGTKLVDSHVVASKVGFGDTLWGTHMVLSRFASFTDLAIMNYLVRSRSLNTFRKNGWIPIIQAETFDYFGELARGDRFRVVTQLACLDGVYFCFLHKFTRDDELVAVSWMVTRVVARAKRLVTAQDVMAAMQVNYESPDLDVRFSAAINELRAQPSNRFGPVVPVARATQPEK